MRHPSNDPVCNVCKTNTGENPSEGGIIWENEHWLVRHTAAPYGVAGWMMLHTQRHVGGPAHFNDAEAAAFGPTLRWLEKTLEEVTGALRIYTAALGESFPHFHAHMVPKYAEMPGDAKAFQVFALSGKAAAGEIKVDAAQVAGIITRYREALKAGPPK
ncbi:MAG: hypothetical protein U0821_27670 [Chloroflexota bacterium]